MSDKTVTIGPVEVDGALAEWWQSLPHGTRGTTLRRVLTEYLEGYATIEAQARLIADILAERGLVVAAGSVESTATGEVDTSLVAKLGF